MHTNAALDVVEGLAAATGEIAVRTDIDHVSFVVVGQVLSAASAATTWCYDGETCLGYLGITAPAATGDQGTGMDALHDLYTEHCIPQHEEALLTTLLGDLSHMWVN
ncbi:hypothetical protein [Streptomyces phaeochromogenes]|uniref:hypothetical protein n=1 Tax=Streptomyces phaeochromogenes TaxID=1923 RepID=UPI00386F6EE2|nr:hypothetical protein OG277_15590 [Streptomyces phaeochromogenes]